MFYEKNGNPFISTCARPDAHKITRATYNKRIKILNDKTKKDKQSELDAMKVTQEYEAQVQAEIRAIAVANLTAKGISVPVKKVN